MLLFHGSWWKIYTVFQNSKQHDCNVKVEPLIMRLKLNTKQLFPICFLCYEIKFLLPSATETEYFVGRILVAAWHHASIYDVYLNMLLYMHM